VRWRTWLSDEIAKMGNAGLRAIPSKTNFLLILFEGAVSAETVYKKLMDQGFITRWLPGQGLANGLRITIGTEEETRGVAAALRKIVS
jgi:histidinol-phosphate aminotransferase